MSCNCHNHEHDHHCHSQHDDSCCCHHHHEEKERIILIIRAICSFLILVISYFISYGITQIILLLISYLIISYDVLLEAFKNITKGKLFDENFLMSIASLTALIVYIFNNEVGIDGFDGVLVILLYQVGEFIQHFAVDKSKDSIEKMLDLDVDNALKVQGDNISIVPLEDIKIDDVILIKPGQKIPLDGVVINGNSSLNMQAITGESKPIDVYKDDSVISGSINNEGTLYVKVNTTTTNSTTAKVKKLIKDASKNKANSEKFITKFARIYTPIVILTSLIVIFVIPMILGFDEYFYQYLYKGLAIMVISCPCALVISIPLSYFLAIGKGAKNAILIKGSNYIEMLANVKSLAFDKTGTLTKGTFSISKLETNNEELFKKILYSCEKNFTHPIALSITNYLKDKTEQIDINDLKNLPGYGLKALYDDKEILIGNEKLLKTRNICFSPIEEIGSVVYVSYDGNYLGYVVIEDKIKDDAYFTLNELKKHYELYLISGDNKAIVSSLANKVNIDNYYYEAMPEDKANIIKNIKEKNSVCYIGDGINDAACLLTSSVGIAMKSLGADLAISASDIVIMDDKISSVHKAIKLSKKTMKIVKENIIISILIKLLIMILAIIVKIPMFVAIIGDVGVCLLAICNSLRIMYGKLS